MSLWCNHGGNVPTCLLRYNQRAVSVLRRSDGTQDLVPVQQLPEANGRLPGAAGHHVPPQIQVRSLLLSLTPTVFRAAFNLTYKKIPHEFSLQVLYVDCALFLISVLD